MADSANRQLHRRRETYTRRLLPGPLVDRYPTTSGVANGLRRASSNSIAPM